MKHIPVLEDGPWKTVCVKELNGLKKLKRKGNGQAKRPPPPRRSKPCSRPGGSWRTPGSGRGCTPSAPPSRRSGSRCHATRMGRSCPSWPSCGSPVTTSSPWHDWLTSTTVPTTATSASQSVCSAAPAPCRLRDVLRSGRSDK